MNYTKDQLPRYKLSGLNLNKINIEIGALQQIIDFYEDYLERKGPYEYVSERLMALYGQLSEYMIAREMHLEDRKTVL
tara:strand:+ start:1004 stop:1237 length:234 start_codon:yes stop_codon:yes gene_type:complete